MKIKKVYSLLFTVYSTILLTLTFSLYNVSYAQHEGHGMVPEKEGAENKAVKPGKKSYYCPMHPSYTSDKPGDCPICNMSLVAAEEIQAQTQAEVPQGAVKIDSYKQQLIGVKTDKVIFRPLVRAIRTVGRVAFDPDLYKTQQEYIEAVKTRDKIAASEDEEFIQRVESLVEAARLKLELSGMAKQQIEELTKNRNSDESLLITTPASAVSWIYATIYEYEIEAVKIGQKVTITAVSYPDKEFKGEVIALDPVFNESTRSIRARIKVDNQEGRLKPNMYVDVQIQSDLGVRLSVPQEAILDSGLRKIAFVSLPDGYFAPREVKTNLSTDEYVEVTEGLEEGDTVVISGNFLIDSESKLKSALEGTGHQHK
jgi:multidrug efflux pump subunit AcrA (membrane-fusion protein)